MFTGGGRAQRDDNYGYSRSDNGGLPLVDDIPPHSRHMDYFCTVSWVFLLRFSIKIHIVHMWNEGIVPFINSCLCVELWIVWRILNCFVNPDTRSSQERVSPYHLCCKNSSHIFKINYIVGYIYEWKLASFTNEIPWAEVNKYHHEWRLRKVGNYTCNKDPINW